MPYNAFLCLLSGSDELSGCCCRVMPGISQSATRELQASFSLLPDWCFQASALASCAITACIHMVGPTHMHSQLAYIRRPHNSLHRSLTHGFRSGVFPTWAGNSLAQPKNRPLDGQTRFMHSSVVPLHSPWSAPACFLGPTLEFLTMNHSYLTTIETQMTLKL